MTDDSRVNAGAPSPWLVKEERVAVGDLVETGNERFAVLYQVGKKVMSARSLEDVNQLALSLVFDCLRAERGALLLWEPERGEFAPRVLQSRNRVALGTNEMHVPRSIINEVVSGRVGLLTSDALHDPRFEARASIRVHSIRSAICAPLWVDDQVLGVIYLDSRLQAYAFTREDLVLLNAIANLIAIRLKQEALNDELVEEKVIRSNLERYHSPDVVEAILRSKERGRFEIGLEERDVTVLFADLCGFTRLAESVSPSTVASLLNAFYNASTKVIFRHGGTVNEYVGDSVLAIFGAPTAHEDHAQRAVDAGIELLRELPSAFSRQTEGLRPQVRIAANTGRVVAGSVGPPDRLKYAVIGDPVNVAARLEGTAQPGSMTIGEETYRCLTRRIPCEDLGPQKLRGRQRSVRAYRIQP